MRAVATPPAATDDTRAVPSSQLAVRRTAHALLALLLAVSHPALAAVITVDNTTCTLVNAVNAANSDAPAGGCPAGSGSDRIDLTDNIVFTAWADGNNAVPTVTSDITVKGRGFTIERDSGAPPFRFFSVGADGTLTLEKVTLSNGSSSVGGAIRTTGVLNLDRTTLDGNSASYGGGLYATGISSTITITNSTISNNSAPSYYGGGIYLSSVSPVASLTMTNSTVSGNSAFYAGGLWAYDGPVTLLNTTFSGNYSSPGVGSNIYGGAGNVTAMNSIVVNDGTGSSCNFGLVDGGNNFSNDPSCGPWGTLTGFDPVLRNNGGPTRTHALVWGSSAVDAGPCVLPADQRGAPRSDGLCDAGAFELRAGAGPPTIPVDGATCTLVDAVTAANTNSAVGGCPAGSGADTIVLGTSVTLTAVDNSSVLGPNGLPVVTESVTIEGGGFTIERDSGAPPFRFFETDSSATLTLRDVTLRNGYTTIAAAYGGALRVNGGTTATLTDCTLAGNSSLGGGAIFVASTGSVDLTRCTVSSNSVTGNGGAIQTYGSAALTDSTVPFNTAYGRGGGIWVGGAGVLMLTNSTVTGNFGPGGGGIYSFAGTTTVEHSTLAFNSPFGETGIVHTGGTMTLTNSIVANGGGGADCSGTITDGGNNFDDDGSCGAGFGTMTGLDPVLRDNGGPTWTHLLRPGSSAIDAAGACGLGTDQRGAPRNDGACDSGAFELGVVVTSVVPPDDSLGVSVGTNVTLTFSKQLHGGTVNSSTILLLDPMGSPVPADVSRRPSGIRVTIDPYPPPSTQSLDFSTVYEVVVTSDVRDLLGTPAQPFQSFFKTVATPPPPTPLDDVSEQTQGLPPPPPSPPPFGGPGFEGVPTGDNLGFSVAAAGDLDGDGIEDFLGGAPGYEGRGAAVVCFGSQVDAERVQSDILFVGEAPGDRAGSTVRGGFFFDHDDRPDLLVAAEQADSTGRVYVIYFRPEEYDSDTGICSGDPAVPCVGDDDCVSAGGTCMKLVDLARVGNPGHPDGPVSGMVLQGLSPGDEVGFALAVGGRLDGPDLPDDMVIGAPGTQLEDGRVYVLFGGSYCSTGGEPCGDDLDCSGGETCEPPTGSHALSEVGTSLPGVIYDGPPGTGARFGAALALPGDIAGAPGGDDIAIGAPLAGPNDEGRVYVAQAGSLVSGTVSASSITTRIDGDQSGARLGFALGAGGDNRGDDASGQIEPDLLIGAPYYQTAAGAEAGRVVQTSERLPDESIAVARVGDPAEPDAIAGVIWKGAEANARLGWSLGRLGDLTGNGLEDIGLGAPYADFGEDAEAGKLYVIEGRAVGTDSAPDLGGAVTVNQIGTTTAGTVLRGSQPNERAGRDISPAGNIDGDAESHQDFTVGSPGWDLEAGTIHQVLEIRIPLPGECSEDPTVVEPCEVADLSTGARLLVPDGGLNPGETAVFDVEGLVDPVMEDPGCAPPTPASCEGLYLAGVADFDPDFFHDTRNFNGLDVSIDVPVSPELEYQLDVDDWLTLMYCDDAGSWVLEPAFSTALLRNNAFVLGRLAARAPVPRLHMWGAFFGDADCDGASDASGNNCDCNGLDPTIWAPPGEARGLVLSRAGAGAAELAWTEPAFRGGAPGSVRYDVIRSLRPDDFETTGLGVRATCLEPSDTSDTSAMDHDLPANGSAYYYIVRAENGCEGIDPGCCTPDEPGCPQPRDPPLQALDCSP